MKYNRRVQLYLSEENSKGRYFKLLNGKNLYLSGFKGQDDFSRRKVSADLKSVFRDLITQAYEAGYRNGRDEQLSNIRDGLRVFKDLLK